MHLHLPSQVGCDMTLKGHRGEIRGLKVGGKPPVAMKDCQKQAGN